MGASAQAYDGQKAFPPATDVKHLAATGTADDRVSPAFWWPKRPSLPPQMSELYRQLQDSKWERQPSLLVAKRASPSATACISIQVATGTTYAAGSVSPALFLVAKPASSSATEGIGIQVARGIQLEGTAQHSDGQDSQPFCHRRHWYTGS